MEIESPHNMHPQSVLRDSSKEMGMEGSWSESSWFFIFFNRGDDQQTGTTEYRVQLPYLSIEG